MRIDATDQPAPPPRGRGPFPGSHLPGHSAGFPLRLELWIEGAPLQPNGSAGVAFLITNIGDEPIKVPVGLKQGTSRAEILTLYITSDAIQTGQFQNGQPIMSIQPTSAELFGDSDEPDTFYLLDPGKTIQVLASTRFALKPGAQSLTAHAELLVVSDGSSKVLGTADAAPIRMRFWVSGHAAQ